MAADRPRQERALSFRRRSPVPRRNPRRRLRDHRKTHVRSWRVYGLLHHGQPRRRRT
jgi:hypothetical protein